MIGDRDALDGGLEGARAVHHLEQAAEQHDREGDGDRAGDGPAAEHAGDGGHEDVPEALGVALDYVVRAGDGVAGLGEVVGAAGYEPGEQRDEGDDGEQDHIRVRHLELLLGLFLG